MHEAMHPSPARSEASMFGGEIPAAFARQAASWMDGQRDLLTNAGTIVADWLGRQRDAIDMSSRSLQGVCDCRNLADLLQAQQQWASECLRWTAAELRAAGRDATTMTQPAAHEGGEVAETLRRETGRRGAAAESEPVRQEAAK